jgi:hypothetical protein
VPLLSLEFKKGVAGGFHLVIPVENRVPRRLRHTNALSVEAQGPVLGEYRVVLFYVFFFEINSCECLSHTLSITYVVTQN